MTYYHLRTGHLLFQGDQARVMYAHLESRPNLSALPQVEAAILARALSKEPLSRWPDCRVFVKELSKAIRKSGDQRYTAHQRTRQEPKKNKHRVSPVGSQPIPQAPTKSPRWIPGPKITNHGGGKLSAKADFFAPPPPELGQILTASTTLNRKEKPLTLTGRWSRAIIAAVGACLIGIMIVLLAEVQLIGWKLTWIAGLPLVGSLIAWLATIFEHSVTYVGTEGVAKIKCRHQRNRISSIEIFRFSTASQLRTGQTRHYRNFAYTNTTYEFTWSNDEGEKIFSISGSYANEKGNPEDDTDSFWFAHSAETVWSWYLLERTLAELDSKGYIHFALSGDDFVRLGPRVIHLHVSGKDARIKAEEMGGISLGGGQFTVKHKDAKPGFLGFGRSGIFKFDYSSMANGRFFLLALEKLMGYKF